MGQNKQTSLGALLGYCGRLGAQHLEKNLRCCAHDITPVQGWAIRYLLCALQEGRSVSQRDLEKHLCLAAPTVNGVVDRLEQKGYLIRTQSPADGRCKLLHPTEQAAAFQTDFEQAAHRTEARLTIGFSPQEQQLLRQMLERLVENLKDGEERND